MSEREESTNDAHLTKINILILLPSKKIFAEIIREIPKSYFFLLSIFSFNNESQKRQPYRERLLEGFIVIDPVTQSVIGGTSIRQ